MMSGVEREMVEKCRRRGALRMAERATRRENSLIDCLEAEGWLQWW